MASCPSSFFLFTILLHAVWATDTCFVSEALADHISPCSQINHPHVQQYLEDYAGGDFYAHWLERQDLAVVTKSDEWKAISKGDTPTLLNYLLAIVGMQRNLLSDSLLQLVELDVHALPNGDHGYLYLHSDNDSTVYYLQVRISMQSGRCNVQIHSGQMGYIADSEDDIF